ncbi:hypothetical protein IAT38_007951 [Cryptococcus sp. DSM 104549]
MAIPFYRPVPAPPGVFGDQPLPEAKASFISKVLFHWATPIMKAGYSRPLEAEDLWTLTDDLACKTIAQDLHTHLLARTPPSKRNSPSHEPISQSTLRCRPPPAHRARSRAERFSAETSRAYVKQARETMAGMEMVDEYAVQHDSRWLESMPGALAEDSHGRAEDDRSKELLEKDLIKKYGNKKAKKIADGKLVVEDGKEYDMSLVRAMYSAVWWRWWKAVIFKGCAAGLQVTAPLVTKLLIDELTIAHDYHTGAETDKTPKSVGYGIGLAFALFAMVQAASLFSYQALQRGSVIGFMMRAGLIDLIGRKSLKLSSGAKVEMTNGKITTMVSADASFLDFSVPMTLDLVVQPVQIAVGLGLLIWALGYSALVGVAVLALAGPIQAYMFTLMVRTRQSQLTFVDSRVRLLSETITAIRAVKLFAYVSLFCKKVNDLRTQELVYLRRNGFNRALMNAMMAFIPTLAAVLTFITYGLSGHELNAAVIFSGLQYFNVLKTPIAFLPMCFTAVSDALVGIGRISSLLQAEEVPDRLNIDNHAKYAIDVRGDFQFEAPLIEREDTEVTDEKKSEHDDRPFALRGIDLRVPRGALVCIVGRVGSGKSALLSGLINEMRQLDGHAVFGGSVSYVPQQAWIHSGSVQDNITFTAASGDIDRARLSAVIDACDLNTDVRGMSDGLSTNVGEKGLLLSGGQRQRLSLARASYSPSSIVLLDDPLSAVDANVAHHILQNCIFAGPLAGRTRVLVTHHLGVLPKADCVLVMERDASGEGRVVQMGSYERLLAQEGPFRNLINEFGSTQNHFPTPTPTTPAFNASNSSTAPTADAAPRTKALDTLEEERETGAIPWSVYTTYLGAMGTYLWPVFFGTLLVMTQVASVGNSLLLGFWSSNSWGLSQGGYMGIYAGLGVAIGVFTFGASYSMFVAGLGASYTLFSKSWEHVMRAPTGWHDKTPSGRIINRLSKDIEMLDDRMAFAWETLLVNGLAAAGTFGLILYTYPWLGLAFIPLSGFFYLCGTYYRQTSREVKRIDSITRSNIYSSFGEQLAGSAVIRAFGKQPTFEMRMQDAINVEGRAYILTLVIQRWLGVRLDLSANLLILLITIMGTVFRNTVDPSQFGVVFSYALAAATLFSNLVSLYAQVELEMNNAERIIHYTSLSQEAAPRRPDDPPVGWPRRGSVEFEGVSLRYNEGGPWVLKDLSFGVQPGEKVGVIGRTGAGKSSLVGAMMRVVDGDGVRGEVLVDGVDVAQVGVDTLREGVGIIPQEAFLFKGTVRENLDPQGKHTDAHLNSLLSLIHTDPIMPSSQSLRDKFRLDAPVGDAGSNFSAGEKQLLALIRALARGTKILLLDEATSSVDPETDALIQRIIQNHLHGVTLISIAHRLQTVAYYDRILVLDGGRVVEYDTPLALHADRDSIFRQLCERIRLERTDLLRLRHDALHAAQGARERVSLWDKWTVAEAWREGVRGSLVSG